MMDIRDNISIRCNDVRVWFQDIGPKLAQELLDGNYDKNRSLRKTYVAQLAKVMSDGRFDSLNGQTVLIDSSNRLFNGQHRMNAIVESGVTLPFLVVQSDHAVESYKTIDTGTKRLVADALRDMPNAPTVASVARPICCMDWGSTPLASCIQGKFTVNHMAVDSALVVDYAHAHYDEIMRIVHLTDRVRKVLGVPIRAIGTAFWLIDKCNEVSMLDEFVDELAKPAPDSKTVTAFKTYIIKAHGDRSRKPNYSMTVGMLLNGYERFIEMDESTAMFNKHRMWFDRYDKRLEAYRARKAQGGE